MNQLIILFRIRVTHEYYGHISVGNYLKLEPTDKTTQLMRRRGVMFRHVEPDTWEWLAFKESFSGFGDDDDLELSLRFLMPEFLVYAVHDGYDPSLAYEIRLSGEMLVNAASALKPRKGEAVWNSEFCRIRWNPSQETRESLAILLPQEEVLPRYTIVFQSCSYVWEYFFVFRDRHDERGSRLLLEEADERLSFGEPEEQKGSIFGENVWRIVSTHPIKAFEHYEYRLILSEVIQKVPLKKRTAGRFLPFPQVGRYSADSAGVIRQVCYI